MIYKTPLKTPLKKIVALSFNTQQQLYKEQALTLDQALPQMLRWSPNFFPLTLDIHNTAETVPHLQAIVYPGSAIQ